MKSVFDFVLAAAIAVAQSGGDDARHLDTRESRGEVGARRRLFTISGSSLLGARVMHGL
jgi:hypothetical protein